MTLDADVRSFWCYLCVKNICEVPTSDLAGIMLLSVVFLFQISHRVNRTPTYPMKQYLPLLVYFLIRLMCLEFCATQWVLWDLEALLWLSRQPHLLFPPRYLSTCIHLAPLFRCTQWLYRVCHHLLHRLRLYSRATSLPCPLTFSLRLGINVVLCFKIFKKMSWV